MHKIILSLQLRIHPNLLRSYSMEKNEYKFEKDGRCGGWHNAFGPWLTGAGSPITFFAWEDGAYSYYEVRKE